MEQVTVSLSTHQDNLWNRFHALQNEMIVTNSGRKMFPKLEYVVRGLVPDKLYALMLHIEPVDDGRYKFNCPSWVKTGKAEQHAEPKKVWHADGVMTGKQWMQSPICFDRVKITNDSSKSNSASMIFLHSMHKYIPVLSIYESNSETPFSVAQALSSRLVATARLPHTEFIAVTAYQNDTITKLKIEHNPFAKGFREGSQGKRVSPCTPSTNADDSTAEESSSQVSSPQPKKARHASTSPPQQQQQQPLLPPPPPPPTLFAQPPSIPPFFLPFLFAPAGTMPPFPYPPMIPGFSPLRFPPFPQPVVKVEQKQPQQPQDDDDCNEEIDVV